MTIVLTARSLTTNLETVTATKIVDIEDKHPNIPDHLYLCKQWLKYLHRRLLRKPSILLEYNNIITEQLSRSIIEVVPNPDTPIQQSLVHYLPHHAVIHQDKQTA